LGGPFKVTKVTILNRNSGCDATCGGKLQRAVVEIGGQACGTVSEATIAGVLYEVVCSTPVVGSYVKIITTADNESLNIAGVKVYGTVTPSI